MEALWDLGVTYSVTTIISTDSKEQIYERTEAEITDLSGRLRQ